MMHKKMIVMVVVVLLVLVAAVRFMPFVPAGKVFTDGAAIVMRSWSDTFNPASDGFLASEITVQGDASSSDGLFSESAASGTAESISMAGDSPGDIHDAVPVPASPEATSSEVSRPACAVSTTSVAAAGPSRRIVFNEIAWMGSPPASGETAAKAGNHEWMELKNTSGGAINLSGWKILDAAGNINIAFESGDAIAAAGFYVVARGDDALPAVHADKTYTGALPNAGETIFLFDDDCALSDVLDASAGWAGGDNATKQTMERNESDGGWHTSALAGGTPHAENSPVPQPTVAASTGGGSGTDGGGAVGASLPPTGSSSTATTSSSVVPAANYEIAVTLLGSGRGSVTSTPPGIDCGITCYWNFSAGGPVVLRATPDTASVFGGWSGACSGTDNICTIVASGSATIAITATFSLSSTSSLPPPLDSASSSTTTSTSTTTTTVAVPQKILIAAVQIAGASTTNDFVKLFNPWTSAVDMSGWRLRKKASTGSDQSLRQFPDGSVIAPHGYFTWANSAGGFSGSLGADASSTATLAVDNSVALFDASGTMMDAVAWGTGVDPYVEGCPYLTDPTANQVLLRIFSNGAIVDTDNNADDFTL